jgi:hypothetical protein
MIVTEYEVQPGTQRGDRIDVRVPRRGSRVRRAGPVQEQPDGRSAKTAHREWPDLPYVLTVNLEPLAAGRQEGDVAGLFQQPLGEDGGSLRDVLAVIQDEQQVPVGQLFDKLIIEALERPLAEPGRGGQCPDHGVRLGHRGEVAEADATIQTTSSGSTTTLTQRPEVPQCPSAEPARTPFAGLVTYGKQVHSFLATSGPVMRLSSGKVAAMMPRDTRIPPAVMR